MLVNINDCALLADTEVKFETDIIHPDWEIDEGEIGGQLTKEEDAGLARGLATRGRRERSVHLRGAERRGLGREWLDYLFPPVPEVGEANKGKVLRHGAGVAGVELEVAVEQL